MSSSISKSNDDFSGTGHRIAAYAKEAAVMRLPGVIPELLDIEFRYVVAEFLSRTLCYRRGLEVPLTPDEGVYRLGLQPYEGVAALLYGEYSRDREAKEGNTLLRMGTPPSVPRMGAWYGVRRAGMIDTQRVAIAPAPSEVGYARFDVALTLTPDIDFPMPDVLLPWQDILLAGLLSRMMAMQDKPYSNLNLAGVNKREFESRMQQVRREVDGGRAYGSIRPRFPKFGR